MSRLVVVSNRVPSPVRETNLGGLVVGLKAALEEKGGLWFGWSGKTAEKPASQPRMSQLDNFTLATLDLTESERRGYYENFANAILWPLFHGRLDLTRFERDDYETYLDVNRKFAKALFPLIEDGDIVWVHDYHLIPLASELRRLGVDNAIGFFLHIPFPQTEDFSALPWHKDLAKQFGAYDLAGFQTVQHHDNFCNHITEHYPDMKMCEDGPPNVGVFPIGIDTRAFSTLAASNDVVREVARLERRMGSQSWIVGVERLDYTKGVAERFKGFEAMLEANPDLRGAVSLVQIAAPSREKISDYQEMRETLEALSGHINGQFSTIDWTPIRFINRAFSQSRLAALYRFSKVGLVTPLRDGMNLVAKEYVAAQDPEDPGILILSRFAGAAEELQDAVLVNPYDIFEIAEALKTALEMPLKERQARWRAMMAILEKNDVHHWRKSFVSALLDKQTERNSILAARVVNAG